MLRCYAHLKQKPHFGNYSEYFVGAPNFDYWYIIQLCYLMFYLNTYYVQSDFNSQDWITIKEIRIYQKYLNREIMLF